MAVSRAIGEAPPIYPRIYPRTIRAGTIPSNDASIRWPRQSGVGGVAPVGSNASSALATDTDAKWPDLPMRAHLSAKPTRSGCAIGVRRPRSDDFGLILAATLTLLALIIGFSFSMATARYDQRKNYEEQEANAIGTEYVRADLLSPVEAAKVRSLLGSYLDQRVLF